MVKESKQQRKIRKKKEHQKRANLLNIKRSIEEAEMRESKKNVDKAKITLRANPEYKKVEQTFELMLYMMDINSADAKDLMLKEGVKNPHFENQIAELRKVTSFLSAKQIDRFDDKSDEQYDGFNELAEFLLESQKLLCDINVEDRIKVLSQIKLQIKKQ